MVEAKIKDYDPSLFFALAHWAKETNNFQPWERSLLYSIGKYLSRGWKISEKQERQATRLVLEARQRGFVEETNTKQQSHNTEKTVKLTNNSGRKVSLEESSIDVLGLNTRSYNALKRAQIGTVYQLTKQSTADLMKLRNLGVGSIEHIANRLVTYVQAVDTSNGDSEDSNNVQGQNSINQFTKNFKRICGYLEDQGILDDFYLPPSIQDNLSKCLNSEVATLANINRFIVSNSLRNAHISMLQPTMHWLEKIQAYSSLDQEVDALVSNLDERESFILLHRFGVDTNLTLEEIGERYEITRERVRQIQAKVQKKLITRTTRIPLFYSQAAILVLRRLGENTSLELWQKKLTDINILKEGSSIRLLVAIGRATGVSKLALPEEFSQWLKQRVSPHILAVSKSVLYEARKLHRNCGAVRTKSLVTEKVSESDVEQILRLNGFFEVYPGWWSKDGGESVPERVATKVIAYCGPVSASEMRYALSKHLSRFQLPAPPSEVIAKVLEKRGEFILNDGLLSRRRLSLGRVNLTGPERLFLKDMKTEGPILSFEIIHFSLVEAGFSTASVTSLLKYSPLVRRIKTPFYTMLGTKYDIADIERVESQLTRVSAKPTIRPRSDGIIEFETNVGSWLAYGGVISSGPVTRMKGAWAIMYNGAIQGELIVEGNFIRGLSSVCKTLDVLPGDRIRIEFNTWKREARIGKVVSNEKVS